MVYVKNEKIEINGKEIYINGILKQKLDNIKKILKKKWDACFLIDGEERVGKSVLGMTCAWYLSDGKITLKNFCKGSEEAREKIGNMPKGSILIVDEGSLVFNSQDSITKEAKTLSKILDIVGYKNMVFIIICPAFYKLKWDIAVRRSKFLLHVYKDKKTWKRGQFAYFGEVKKKQLFENAKKTYGSYKRPHANFVGSFTKFEPFGAKYEEVKEKTLLEEVKKKDSITQRDLKLYIALTLLSEAFKLKDIIDGFKKYGESMSEKTIYRAKKRLLNMAMFYDQKSSPPKNI